MFARYALYFTPTGPLAEVLADWLGWDPITGTARSHPDLANLPRPVAELTERPRKYGAHATLKPPFHLATGPDAQDAEALEAAVAAFAATRAPVALDGLAITRIGSFLALTPVGDTAALSDLAADCVRHFDDFRAPPNADELARRRQTRLSPTQESNLAAWGYPYVMDDFRFHITLTGPLRRDEIDATTAALTTHLTPHLTAPFQIDALSLLGGDRETGRFHMIRRAQLTG
ncbi:DUF1045 domain-containing protein [Marinovum sp. 2_MG-2023]|uniref:DUF1045 domain-containing protein n=1 Tax=unclassified Marinovum TaxID=2647166 RepID=UPI0026E19C24|nr:MULTISPECIES: DUF1045 domain-containing protein [unclassified Marinovum]MDO6729385.1 DUF1045 domain-containing protein [Marinovum sp. 2_MG-2023]MDO6780399.1 DUF1045 domain-containing protein [Marinovum sp. 1_MG-2023]